MTRITVDPKMGTQLRQQHEQVEVCDETGRVLGVFLPFVDTSLYEGADPEISAEEIRRRIAEGGGRPLVDILADLERRG